MFRASKTVLLLFPLFLLAALLSPAAADENGSVYLPFVTDSVAARSWETLRPITLQPTPFSITSAIDASGRLHLIWESMNPPRFVYHTFWTGTTWTDPQPIAQPEGISYLISPPIADAQGNLHLLWLTDRMTVEGRSRLHYARFSGQQWQTDLDIYQSDNLGVGGRLIIDDIGRLLATVTDEDVIRLGRTAGDWTTLNVIELDYLSLLGVWPDLLGAVHVYGDQSLLGGVSYTRWKDGIFEVEYQPIGDQGAVTFRTLRMDQVGNLHTFWRGTVPIPGGTVSGLYHQCRDRGLTWSPEQVLSGQAELDSYASVDNAPRVAAVWSAEGIQQMAVWEGCNLLFQDPVLAPLPATVVDVAYRTAPHRLCLLAQHELSLVDFTAACVTLRE